MGDKERIRNTRRRGRMSRGREEGGGGTGRERKGEGVTVGYMYMLWEGTYSEESAAQTNS